MYVNYFDREIKTANENDAVAEYVLGEKQKQIFTSRYQHELPTVEELKRELQREMELLTTSPPAPLRRGEVKKEKRTSK
jgi:hypothetical protein